MSLKEILIGIKKNILLKINLKRNKISVFNFGSYIQQNRETTVDWITKNSVPISSKKDNSNGTQLASGVYIKWTNFSKNIN